MKIKKGKNPAVIIAPNDGAGHNFKLILFTYGGTWLDQPVLFGHCAAGNKPAKLQLGKQI